jgi:hypothetical protein
MVGSYGWYYSEKTLINMKLVYYIVITIRRNLNIIYSVINVLSKDDMKLSKKLSKKLIKKL